MIGSSFASNLDAAIRGILSPPAIHRRGEKRKSFSRTPGGPLGPLQFTVFVRPVCNFDQAFPRTTCIVAYQRFGTAGIERFVWSWWAASSLARVDDGSS